MCVVRVCVCVCVSFCRYAADSDDFNGGNQAPVDKYAPSDDDHDHDHEDGSNSGELCGVVWCGVASDDSSGSLDMFRSLFSQACSRGRCVRSTVHVCVCACVRSCRDATVQHTCCVFAAFRDMQRTLTSTGSTTPRHPPRTEAFSARRCVAFLLLLLLLTSTCSFLQRCCAWCSCHVGGLGLLAVQHCGVWDIFLRM